MGSLPLGSPPVLLSLDYGSQQPPLPDTFAPVARYSGGQLRVNSSIPDGNQGIAADQTVFRDVILQAQISLAEGSDEDLYGLFLRSPSPELYYIFAVSPAGQAFVSSYDGTYTPVVSGPLAPEMHFGYGVGTPNVFEVISVGPSMTFLLNGMLVAAEIADERYTEGYLGFYVHHGSQAPRAELGVDWIDIRGVFPDNP